MNEIKNFQKNSSVLRYMQGNADTFGGNLTTLTRFSYFDRQNDSIEIPCGFLKQFPISNSGQFHMNSLFRSQFTLVIFNHHVPIGYMNFRSLNFIELENHLH